MKTVYYYQTPCDLEKCLVNSKYIDVIIVSSLHFGLQDDKPYIHLNDNYPTSSKYDKMWMDLEKLYYNGTSIMCMVGGAGGAFNNLFSDYDTYYPMLKEFLKGKKMITGIDLDVEEDVDIKDVKKLLNDLVKDFGEDFTITMAPVAESLETDNLSGFSSLDYKSLYKSLEGRCIKWFNVQAYGNYNKDTYDKIISNDYPPEKIVFGMISGSNFDEDLKQIKLIKESYPNFLGCDIWELNSAPPNTNDPSQWAYMLKNIDYSNRDYLSIWAP